MPVLHTGPCTSVSAPIRLPPLQAGGIWVDRQWRGKEGQHLTEDLVLGKVLGSGFQVRRQVLL
jgi:hypothetical protein